MRTLWAVLVLALLGLQYKLWLGDGNIYQWLSLEHKNIAQEDINKKLRSRNIALTAPYFHTGAVPTLDEAVRVMAKVQLDKDLKDTQMQDIVAFLNTLTGEFPQQTMPRLPGTLGKSVISTMEEPH